MNKPALIEKFESIVGDRSTPTADRVGRAVDLLSTATGFLTVFVGADQTISLLTSLCSDLAKRHSRGQG